MKARFFTSALFLLLTVLGIAGPIDGHWRCAATNSTIEIIYTRDGIKVRDISWGGDRWDFYNNYGENRYRDNRGNIYAFVGDRIEFSSFDRRNSYHYDRYERRDGSRDWGRNDRDDRDWGRGDRNRDWNDRNWDRRDRDDWNRYYKSYEGRWHNHTTGERITIDLSRRSLRIKFKGEKWFEVVERNRGLFVDRRGNEFIFRGDIIEFRANNNDLVMRFNCDARCDHRDDDYRSDYWRW